MKIAHVCPCCGQDLSGVRAPPDRVYALPVVVCASCRSPSVRRTLLERWHARGIAPRATAIGRAIGALGMVLVIVGASLGIIVFNASALRVSLLAVAPSPRMTRPEIWLEEYGHIGLILLMLGPIPASLVLRWALPYLRTRGRTLVWLGGVAGFLWVVPGVVVLLDSWFSLPVRYTNFSVTTRPTVHSSLDLGDWLWPVLLGAFLSIMLVSEPVATRFGRYTFRRRLRGRLARARRRRLKGRQ